MMKLFVAVLLLVVAALGDEDRNYDPELNYRPENVTDLAYYLYGWRGSYYNGSTTFTLKPRDWGEDNHVVCGEYRKKTITWEYESLVAIAEPSEDDDGDNPIMLLVRSYLPSADLWPNGGNVNAFPEQINADVFHLDSIEPKHRSYSNSEVHTPNWNISTKHISESAYSFTGSSNIGGEPLQNNMTHCDGTPDVWWGGWLLTSDANERLVDSFIVSDPIINGRFDDSTATFTINGFFHLNTDREAPEDVEELYGEVTIDFQGDNDEARSDRLLEGSKPGWEPTVGFVSETVGGDDESGAIGKRVMASLGSAILAMVLSAVLC